MEFTPAATPTEVLILSNWTYGSITAVTIYNFKGTAVLILSNWTYGSILKRAVITLKAMES